MANNIWNNYTEKTATPVDADEVMVRDSTDGKNKRLLFGTFWKWVAKKLNEATISELQTSNKTIIGAINALNSDTFRAFNLTSYDAILTDLKSFNYGIARYAHIANDAPSDDNGFLISLYRNENARAQIALSDLGNLYVRTANSAESFNEWIVYNKI